ncbi:MAG: hypothetical protein L6V84_00750 [Oscillospiraceae bacterium]|nr:MAG: hypothetical protein L6V84_00750 [Oscillospiraceae bacterium]
MGHIDISDKNDLPIWGKTSGIQIQGVKHLDMNGYNISYEHTGVGYSEKFVYKDAVNKNAKYLYYLMTVTEDASFYLYDSTGKNGKIFFGQPMYVSEMPYRNIISVKGRFTMYGGEISTGASKKLYYTDVRTVNYYGEDKHTFSYTGNLRLQLQGSGVTVENGGYFEMNGGDVYGRGTHFAAIEGRPGSTVFDKRRIYRGVPAAPTLIPADMRAEHGKDGDGCAYQALWSTATSQSTAVISEQKSHRCGIGSS